jgi:hypothetical protein
MNVHEILSDPNRYIGRCIQVEGSVHLGTFEDQKKRVWVSNPIADSAEQPRPQDGLLIKFPGIVGRFIPQRSGPIFPMIGFECKATFVYTELSPWTYALVDLRSARYFQRTGDPWNAMNLELLPERSNLIDIIGAKGYSDEDRAGYVMEYLKRLTDW